MMHRDTEDLGIDDADGRWYEGYKHRDGIDIIGTDCTYIAIDDINSADIDDVDDIEDKNYIDTDDVGAIC